MLIYTPNITARIRYILDYFNEKLLWQAELTDDAEYFASYKNQKLNYSDERIDAAELYIKPAGLLHETGLRKQFIECFDWKNVKAFYKADDDFGFDIFSASFYLITRYEEYLEHEPDEYGRYAHWNSLAWKEGFLQKPLIDTWLLHFVEVLKSKFSDFKLQTSNFKFLPTYNIDIAWSYKHKGLWRSIAASIKNTKSISHRIKVMQGKEKDPFDSYEWMNELHKQHELKPVYFFLLAEENSRYDKNILPKQKALQQLVYSTAQQYSIGLHPSTKSNVIKEMLLKEKQSLETISKQTIKLTRHHYILFHLPHSYRELINAGFTDDYSMGYGTVNGFRASTSHSYLWYDLEKEESTALRIHPYAYMEANSFYELHQSAQEALAEMLQLCNEVKKVNGTFISIYHNHFLGTDEMFKGWKEMYEEFVNEIAPVVELKSQEDYL